MKCLATFSENQILHKMKLRKIQVRTLNGLYHRPHRIQIGVTQSKWMLDMRRKLSTLSLRLCVSSSKEDDA